jgi:hypothetical protein
LNVQAEGATGYLIEMGVDEILSAIRIRVAYSAIRNLFFEFGHLIFPPICKSPFLTASLTW